MYQHLKQFIELGGFPLQELLLKINTIWVEGQITLEQRNELKDLAFSYAKPEFEYASVDDQITARFEALEARVTTLESQLASLASGETPSIPDADEYPEYVQPTGAHDAYHTGDKVTFEGKHYICKLDPCAWSPAVYPQGWDEVKDGDTDE